MSYIYKFKIYCSTDSQWEYVWSETKPTVCPVNAAHTIDSSSISVNNNDKLRIKTIDSTDSPYRQKKNSLYLDTSAGNIIINLMKAAKGKRRVYYLKKLSAANSVTLNPYGSELIDGQSSKTMSSLGEILILISDGVTWSTYGDNVVVTVENEIQENNDITGTKGEILVDDGNELSILTLGTNGQVLTADSTTNLGIKWETQASNESTFGSEYNYVESLTTSTTTMESWQQKLKLTTSSLPSGDYKLSWSAEFSNSTSNKGMDVRLQHNDTTEIAYNGSAGNQNGLVVPWQSFSGLRKITLSGVNTFDIDYKRGDTKGNAQIRRVTIELFRIS